VCFGVYVDGKYKLSSFIFKDFNTSGRKWVVLFGVSAFLKLHILSLFLINVLIHYLSTDYSVFFHPKWDRECAKKSVCDGGRASAKFWI